MTAKQFIKDYTNHCSNELADGGFHEWLTPEQALRAVEIAKDAFIEKACDAYCRLCDTKECGDTGECEWVEKFRKRLMR